MSAPLMSEACGEAIRQVMATKSQLESALYGFRSAIEADDAFSIGLAGDNCRLALDKHMDALAAQIAIICQENNIPRRRRP